jgi:LacI family transcriptional regulator
MPPRDRRNVALLIESSRSYGRGLLRGVAQFSRTHGAWSLLHEEMTIDADLPAWLTEAGAHGVIARLDAHIIEPLRRLKVPIVDVRCRRDYPGIPQVETDDSAVARLVFEHLWQRGFRRFAFCGYRGAHYSENRLQSFRSLVSGENCPLEVYETEGAPESALTSIERSGVLDVHPLSAWLSSLQPPTGLFVCNDIRGQQALNACRKLGISVPDDLGVIGVDDDDTICPLSDPPLSSVRPDADRIGYRAAEMLAELMKGGYVGATTEYIPPVGIAQRLSTQVIAVEDREVARACQFIREHACDGIDVGDVARRAKLSRRQLERRFRAALGRTPRAEISSVQIARAKQLLAETDLSLEQLAPLAGYDYKESLSAVFKRETGMTPGAYRRDQRSLGTR